MFAGLAAVPVLAWLLSGHQTMAALLFMALWAGLPRAYCKFSGCGMFDAKWSAASARRHFDTIVELFGTSRVMFGSNFPVERLARSYTDVWGDYFELGRAFGDRALSEMCHDNAQRFYRL